MSAAFKEYISKEMNRGKTKEKPFKERMTEVYSASTGRSPVFVNEV